MSWFKRKCMEDPNFKIEHNRLNRERYRRAKKARIAKTGEYQAQRKKDDPRYTMLNAARFRANKKGLEFNIDLEDIIIPKFCPILLI